METVEKWSGDGDVHSGVESTLRLDLALLI